MEGELLTDFYVFQRLFFRETKRNDARAGNRCHYIGYMRRGEGVIRGEGLELSVSEGELFYIPKGFSYVSVWSGEEGACFDSFGFSRFPIPLPDYPLQRVPTDEGIREAVETLAAHKTVTLGAVAALWTLVERMLPHMTARSAGAGGRVLAAALAYLQNATELSVPALARHCRVSESGLYAAFRRGMGCTPVEAWHRVLCARAEELLQSTELSVEEIAARLGFCSASYFRKILRRVTGRSPRELRARARI